MADQYHETVLLVCDDPRDAQSILEQCFENDIDVVGPAPTASMALALAAQSAPTLALLARPPAGRRGARRLAADLLRLWGIRSHVLGAALGREERYVAEPEPWTLSSRRAARLDRILSLAAKSQHV